MEERAAGLEARAEVGAAACAALRGEIRERELTQERRASALAMQVCELKHQLNVEGAAREAERLQHAEEATRARRKAAMDGRDLVQIYAAEKQQQLEHAMAQCRDRELSAQLAAKDRLEVCRRECDTRMAAQCEHGAEELWTVGQDVAAESHVWRAEAAQLTSASSELLGRLAVSRSEVMDEMDEHDRSVAALLGMREAEQCLCGKVHHLLDVELVQHRQELSAKDARLHEVQGWLTDAESCQEMAREQLHAELQ